MADSSISPVSDKPSRQSAGKRGEKPQKPHPDFPLFAHATGRWAKKVAGVMRYYGPWSDPDGALQKWLELKDYHLAKRTPPEKRDGVTVKYACNAFLEAKERLVDSGELSRRQFGNYFGICKKIIDQFGGWRLVEDLRSEDFREFRSVLSKGRGLVTLANDVRQVRIVFKWAADEKLIPHPVEFGREFRTPAKSALRRSRTAKGQRMFEAAEVRTLLDSAKEPLRTMILLSINTGFGQSDISALRLSNLDLESGWVDYPRPKTGVERRAPLWPETIESLRKVIDERKEPKDPGHADLVFLTRCRVPWVRVSTKGGPVDAVACEFAKLLSEAGLKRPGLGYYALRHSFETVGGGSRDQVATSFLMGHSPDAGDMSAVYRERIDDDRLVAVVEHVRRWLFPEESQSEQKSGDASSE